MQLKKKKSKQAQAVNIPQKAWHKEESRLFQCNYLPTLCSMCFASLSSKHLLDT